ncbi:MAG: hypothetical protein ACRDKU_07955, partial [Gaiellaceae bacterium]
MSDENKIPSGTAEGLMEFLDFLVEKGYGTSAAITPWKSAANRVFIVVEKGEDFGSVDVRSLDMDDYLERWNTLALGTSLKRESIVTYGTRFEKAVTAYREYLEHKRLPSLRRIGTRTKVKAASQPAAPAKKNGNGNGTNGHGAADVEISSLIDYPFPLRTGQIAHLRLPTRLE